MKQNDIRVYTTPSCHWCHKLKEYLRDTNVRFKEIDVSADESKALEMHRLSGSYAVPVIAIDSFIIVGFNKPALDAAIRQHMKVHA